MAKKILVKDRMYLGKARDAEKTVIRKLLMALRS